VTKGCPQSRRAWVLRFITRFYQVFKASRDWEQLGEQRLSPVTVDLGFMALGISTYFKSGAVPSHGRPGFVKLAVTGDSWVTKDCPRSR